MIKPIKMKKRQLYLLFSLWLPYSSFAGVFSQPQKEFSFQYFDYQNTKDSVADALKKQSISTDGVLYDRCRDNGLYKELYTWDRRCYLTEEQTSKAPYNAIVALTKPEDGFVYCTGTIVKNPNDGKLYVYTAAHCTNRTGANPIHVRMQDGNEMDCEPAYVGFGSDDSDVAMYKISKEYENDVPFVTTGNMQSGYVEIIGYGSLPIMNNNQIKAFHQTHADKLRELDVDQNDFYNFSIRSELYTTLPKDSHLKGSFHCYLAQDAEPFDKEHHCQSWHGNSGGPIFDENGKLVAILTGGYANLSTDRYAVTPVNQEIVSDAEDEFIFITSKSKLRNEAGDCFRITDQKGNLVEESADKCQDIPLGSWSVVLGKGEYSGVSRCSASSKDDHFGINPFDYENIEWDSLPNGYEDYIYSNCWCKTNGVNSNWKTVSIPSLTETNNDCIHSCTQSCFKDFSEEENSLTQPKSTKRQLNSTSDNDYYTPYNNPYAAEGDTVIAHTPSYCVVMEGTYISYKELNSTRCKDLPVDSWEVTYADNTKYTGISKCTTSDTVFDDKNIDSLPNGKNCWCKLDGTNTKWEKTGWIHNHENFATSAYDNCDNVCASECARNFMKSMK